VADQTVRISGLPELNRAFKAVDADLPKELRKELKQVAEPVRVEAALRSQQFGARTSSGIKTVARSSGSVAVRQSRKKNADAVRRRPNFGPLLMRTALEPALTHHEAEIVRGLEHILDRLADKHGF
jgi:hypothetical protein